MSLLDGRNCGKRFRKPQSGNSNLRNRWKYLSTDIDDVIAGSTPRIKKLPTVVSRSRLNRSALNPTDTDEFNLPVGHKNVQGIGYDIDGDGHVDVREMRMAKLVDHAIEQHSKTSVDCNGSPKHFDPSELDNIRQKAGRLLLAQEFIERNEGQLWRYGSAFVEKNEKQCAEFIAGHHHFPKLMAYLESIERKRVIRTSRNVRGTLQGSEQDKSFLIHRQTWVESAKKIQDPHTSKFPLPGLEPKPRQEVIIGSDEDVQINSYGAIDVDGDGVIDFDGMKLHMRLKAASLNDCTNPSMRKSENPMQAREDRKSQQFAGRRMMATDFVNRNHDKMWLYDPKLKGKSVDEIVDAIASSDQFSKEFNKWRTKERMLTLKSSIGVATCIQQSPTFVEPSNGETEFRRVKDRTELFAARKELLKPPEQRYSTLLSKDSSYISTIPFGAVREDIQTPLSRSQSQLELRNLPVIYDTPHRLETIGSFSITKWKV